MADNGLLPKWPMKCRAKHSFYSPFKRGLQMLLGVLKSKLSHVEGTTVHAQGFPFRSRITFQKLCMVCLPRLLV